MLKIFLQEKCINLKQKISEIEPYPICLGHILRDFTIDNLKKNMSKRKCTFFFVEYDPLDTSKILGIHNILMKETQYKIMFRIIKKNVYCIINQRS